MSAADERGNIDYGMFWKNLDVFFSEQNFEIVFS
jgi:hypothetical protein